MNRYTAPFRVRTLVLAMALTGGVMSTAQAASTPTTASVQGSVPILSAPSNSAVGAVDFSGTYATAGSLSTGDTLVMTYDYNDSDGDLDNSLSTVVWSYLDAGTGLPVTITAVNVPAAAPGGSGTSTIVVPAGAIGAAVISVTLIERSATGDPLSGNTLNIGDISTGGGGTSTVPPGPIVPGGNVAGGYSCNLTPQRPAAGPLITPEAVPIHRWGRLTCSGPEMTATVMAYGMQVKPT